MPTYNSMDRVQFFNLIGENYFGPVLSGQRYADLCNKAEDHNMEIVAFLEDSVVFKLIVKPT